MINQLHNIIWYHFGVVKYSQNEVTHSLLISHGVGWKTHMDDDNVIILWKVKWLVLLSIAHKGTISVINVLLFLFTVKLQKPVDKH